MRAFTSAEPPLVEPPKYRSSELAAALSEYQSIRRSSTSSVDPCRGLPSVRARAVTAIASFSVEAAGNEARAFHDAPAPEVRLCT